MNLSRFADLGKINNLIVLLINLSQLEKLLERFNYSFERKIVNKFNHLNVKKLAQLLTHFNFIQHLFQ